MKSKQQFINQSYPSGKQYYNEKSRNQFKLDDIDFITEFDKKQEIQNLAKRSDSWNTKQSKNSAKSQSYKIRNQKPLILKRTVYVLLILSFMMAVCFYYDLLQNENFLSLILGFVACIVFQVKVLQYAFKKQMYKMQIDEYGALRAKIKYFFGELNTNYLDQKNRKKYYHHILSQQDKLFDKQNEVIYDNTMQFLISKTKINHLENIDKIKRKWKIIIAKYQIMRKFVNSFMEIHSSRAKLFEKYLKKINSTCTESDYVIWNNILKINNFQKQQPNKNQFQTFYKFFKTKSIPSQNQKRKQQLTDASLSEDGFSMSQNTFLSADVKKQLQDLKTQGPGNMSEQRQQHNYLSWKQLISVLQYRDRINSKKLNYMKQSILDEIKLDSQKIKNEKQLSIKSLQLLKNTYQIHIKQKQEYLNKIQNLKTKIDQISNVIHNKNRTTQNNQEICKMELEIRMKKVQIENLEVKVAVGEDLIKKNSYQLYTKCRDMNKQLQTIALPKFNNKLSNYINMLLDYQKRCSKFIFNTINEYTQKNSNSKQITTSTSILNQYNVFQGSNNLTQQEEKIKYSESFQQLYEIYRKRQKSQQNMKIFFQETKKFYKEISVNLQLTVSMIETYQKQLFQQINGETTNQNGRKINFTNKDKLNDHDYLPTLTTNYATNLLYDRYFLNVLASLSRKDEKIFGHCVKIFQKQSQLVNSYVQTYCKPANMNVQRLNQKNKKIQDQLRKLQKTKSKVLNLDEFQILVGEVQYKMSQVRKQIFIQISKRQSCFVPSLINDLTSQIIQKHYKLYQYILIHEKKSFHFQAPTQNEEQQQNRNIKFKEYQIYALKVQKMNFDDPSYESLSRSSQNRTQTKKKPANQVPHKITYLNSKQKTNLTKLDDIVTKDKHQQSKEQSLRILNKLLGVLFQEWSNSQFFHDLIKEELQVSLNAKRPGIVQQLHIQHLKVQEKTKESGFEDLIPHASQMYRCLFDVKLNFKGKIAVHIKTRLNFGNRTPLNIQLLIKQFVCPVRICFNPYSIAKSYVSLLERPFLNIQYDVKIGEWHINRIPFVNFVINLSSVRLQKYLSYQNYEKKCFGLKEQHYQSHQLLKIQLAQQQDSVHYFKIKNLKEKQIEYKLSFFLFCDFNDFMFD